MPAFAATGNPREFARVLLTDATGRPLRAGSLRPQVNYVFHYPYNATPVFLLNLGRPLQPESVNASAGDGPYAWPGGVGPNRSIVAYSAICSHRLVYPTREVSFISFRKDRARRGVQDQLIHCCADHSQFDPFHGASVIAGPAGRPLAAVLLAHDPAGDTLTAFGTLGSDMFEAFFERYAAKLSIEAGPTARETVRNEARVLELEKYCKNNVQC
jgi:arsenite oxidase small subunit